MKLRLRLEPLLLAVVCFGPVIGAYVLYYGGNASELPRLANKERELLLPPPTLPPLAVQSVASGSVDNAWAAAHWSLIYGRTSACVEECIGDLLRLRQVHLSLGKDETRVQRVYLGVGSDDPRLAEDPFLLRGRFDSEGAELLELLESIDQAPSSRGRVYVVDPNGNLVLSYPADPDQNGLRDDLKRLLSVSRIG